MVVRLGISKVKETDIRRCVATGYETFCSVDEERTTCFVWLEAVTVNCVLS